MDRVMVREFHRAHPDKPGGCQETPVEGGVLIHLPTPLPATSSHQPLVCVPPCIHAHLLQPARSRKLWIPGFGPPLHLRSNSLALDIVNNQFPLLFSLNRRYNLNVPELTCKHCTKKWGPEFSDFVRSGYWPATMQAQTLFHQDLFHSFEAMKTAAPGMSRQAVTAMLDQRTKQFGRTGKVNADAFQRSFLQYVYCTFEENKLLGKEPFVCPACSPEMVAVSVDGNRKLYRFQKTNQSEEPGFFDGVFLAQDSEVSTFVEDVRGPVKSILWNARNQEGAGTTLGEEVEQVNSFLSRCALTTKYMAKSARTDMLTVHAMGWNHRKENGLHIALSSRFKKTAEKTEAVTKSLKKMQDQLNCSDDMLELWVDDVKQWASKGSASASPADAGCLQISIEALFVSICQKKHYLLQTKWRQKIAQKIAQEKKRLLEDIHKYNQQPDGDPIDTNTVVEKLSTKSAESMIWPWQEPNRDGVDILTKKGLFDQKMLLSRLTEKKHLLVKEMMQHCQYLKDSVSKVQTLMAPVSLITQTGSYPNGITEEGYKGLMCLLRRNLHDLRLKQQTVAGAYRGILEPSPRLVEEDEDMEEEKDWQSDNSSDDEDDAEEGT
ncbi:hypothetical protein NQZ68_032616 [Dissostichus eleginoides]|nr:hypothetical protein NQZ68_032616 [Dissostichus eleginoides]